MSLNVLPSDGSTAATGVPALPQPRRFYIETWGCQMNELDTQRMSAQLMQEGILPTGDPSAADLILLNSCSVREKAAQKAYSQLGVFRKLKRNRPDLLLGFCGCVAQQEGESALKRLPDLDFVIGPGRVGELRALLDRRRRGERIVATGFPDATTRNYDIDRLSRETSYKGMVTIIEGCNKKCTFCIVPTTRGAEQCRRMDAILDEVRHLLDYGFVEIELLGQTVNHWRDPNTGDDFAVLLDRVARLPGLTRLRFVTSYPRDFTPAMVAQFAEHENLSPYLHLPVQSGSNTVLKRMGRGYEIDLYRRLIDRLRAARPDINLSTDIIVGFPGETDDDFQATLDLAAEVRYGSIYAFKYSPRPGTAAPRLKLPAVPPDVADARLQALFAQQEPIGRALNEALVGTDQTVLVTGWGKQAGTQSGRTACHRIVHFPYGDAPRPMGSLTPVTVERALAHSLLGTPIADSAADDVRAPAIAATT
ncbi:MAG: tRNA (N6-isopentenyl adenosine(37)-C2)-methylthiotransferase MiaB [Acidobacteriota bacterium]